MQAHFHLFFDGENFKNMSEEKNFWKPFDISQLKSKAAFSIRIQFEKNGLQSIHII